MPTCKYCKAEVELKNLRMHLESFHQIFAKSSVVFSCGEKGCYRCFGTWKTYVRHLRDHHKFCDGLKSAPQADTDRDSSDELNDHFLSAGSALCGSATNSSPSLLPCASDQCQRKESNNIQDLELKPQQFNRYITELKETVQDNVVAHMSEISAHPGVSRKTSQQIIQGTGNLMKNCVLSLKDKLLQSFHESENLSGSTYEKIDALFDVVSSSFDGLSSEYLWLKYLKERDLYIEPQSIAIDVNEELLPGRVNPIIVRATYIPIIEVLTKFFNRPGVFDKVQKYIASLTDDVHVNFIQSSLWKSKVSQYPEKLIFPIFLYFDDFQINNVLGSHGDSGKTGSIQLSIPVLPPEYRSKLENIFVIQLFKAEDREESGNKAMFQRLISDLNFLFYQGIEVLKGSDRIKVFFLMGAFAGDNLGLNDMFGFVKSFSANYFCRMCKVHKKTSQTQVEEDPSLHRSRLDYEQHILLKDASQTGIREECVWNGAPMFHAIENESVDPMHDFFSNGIVNYDLGEILHYFIFVANLFTLDTFNYKLAVFDHGSFEGENIPPPIKEDDLKKKWISMSAGETRTLVRSIGLLIGNLVPVGNDIWGYYLLLRNIIDIVLAREVTADNSDILKELIREHNKSFIEFFNRMLPPKFHILVHYPRLMLKLGPLTNISCFRFEGKNRDQKQTARTTTSRRNPTLTIAIKEQIKFAHKSLLNAETQPTCSHHSTKRTSTSHDQTCRSIVLYGTKFKTGMRVAVGLDDNGIPMFGTIKDIILSSSGLFHAFTCDLFETEFFDHHYHAYQVSRIKTSDKQDVCIVYEDLLDVFPLNFNICQGKFYITPRNLI